MTAEAVDAFEYAARQFEVQGYESPWRTIARPGQLPPPMTDPWLTWLFLAGRGAGKTRSAAEAVAELMRRYPGCRVALVARTSTDVRDTLVEGESGLLAVLDDTELRGGDREKAWNRSFQSLELYLANGSMARGFSSEKPGKLRGPQHHFAWGDEAAVWKDAHIDTGQVDTTWSNLILGLRLPRMPGWPDDYAPRVLVTTTPRRCALLRVPPSVVEAEPHRAGLTQKPATVVTTGRTDDNLDNLAGVFLREVVEPLRGTRLGRQELDAELLDDVQGALLQQAWIDAARRRADEIPALVVTAVGVDPATTATETSDLTGIVACGIDADMHGYVLADASGRYSPEEWATVAWQLAINQGADVIVVEDNAGGDMVETTLKVAWLRFAEQERARGNPMPPRPLIVRVTPSGEGQGKWARAQPVALMYEQQPGRIHHVTPTPTGGAARPRNPLEELEDQATTWTGDPAEPSPDRVDAMVHALRWMLFPASRKKPREQPQRGPVSQRWTATGPGRR